MMLMDSHNDFSCLLESLPPRLTPRPQSLNANPFASAQEHIKIRATALS